MVTLTKNVSDALLPLRHFQCAKAEQTDADMVTAWLRSLLLAKCSSSQSLPCAVCNWRLLFSPHRCTHRAVTLDSRLILISFFFFFHWKLNCSPCSVKFRNMLFLQETPYIWQPSWQIRTRLLSFISVLHWHLGVLICLQIKKKDMRTFSHELFIATVRRRYQSWMSESLAMSCVSIITDADILSVGVYSG